MIALSVSNVKGFMYKLLLKETFDSFLVSSAQITTFASFSIDGQLHREFFAQDDQDTEMSGSNVPDKESQIRWRDIRPFCLQVIKGKRLPLSFHFILQLPSDEVLSLLEENDLHIAEEDVFGFFLNIQYRSQELTVTTGSSLRVFSMAHPADQAWDRKAREFLEAEELV